MSSPGSTKDIVVKMLVSGIGADASGSDGLVGDIAALWRRSDAQDKNTVN